MLGIVCELPHKVSVLKDCLFDVFSVKSQLLKCIQEAYLYLCMCVKWVAGPERELSQLPVFGELLALLPGLQIYIDFIGPSVPIAR